MMPVRLGISMMLALAAVTGAHAQPAAGSDAGAEIHDRVLVLDAHADILLPSAPPASFLPGGGTRVDLDHLIEGGVDAVVLAVAVGPGPRDAEGVAAARDEADDRLAAIHAFAASDPGRIGLALSARDVEQLHRAGKIAVLISFQNARSIGHDLSQIDLFYQKGVRVFALTHAGHNDFADSSRPAGGPPSEHGGLSPLGRDAVKRLNALGALIDVSQLSTDALFQTLALSRAPVAATHSSARALVDDPRNLSDAELDAIGKNGGVVQVVPFSPYVHRVDEASLARISTIRLAYGLPEKGSTSTEGIYGLSAERQQAFLGEIRKAQTRGTIAEFVDHIDYIAKRIGWRHVGVGTDFNHGGGVGGFESAADAAHVTRELVRRGYSEEQIAGIWGGNFLRVLRGAEHARAP